MKNYVSTFLVLFFIVSNLLGQSAKTLELRNALQHKYGLELPLANVPLVLDDHDTVAFIFTYKNGYLVLSDRQDLYPLTAYSAEGSLDTADQSFNLFVSLLRTGYIKQRQLVNADTAYALRNRKAWDLWLQGKIETKQSIGPLLKSEYGQVNCKDENGNYIYVTNYYTPNHYAVGCVALVLATTMRYYQWPQHGKGSFTYTDNYGSSRGTYSANFENTTYQWSLIQDKYYKVHSTDESRRALGRVAFDAAVALEMDFESTGSTSNINRIPAVASKYFRYERPEYLTSTDPDFWTKVDSSLLALSPVQFAVYTESGMGHAIVCDGVQQTSDPSTALYHLNMGWWGVSNGWYTIQSGFNAGGYSIISAAVMGMLPIPEIAAQTFNIADNTITVRWIYSPVVTDASFEVQIRKGDSGEWETIASNIKETEYTFPADTSYKYYIRVKESRNITWSDDVMVDPQYYLSVLSKARIYPSYIYDHFYVQYANLDGTTLMMYDQGGTLIFSKKLAGEVKQRIDLPDFTPGLYFVKLVSPDNLFGFKIIIMGHNPLY